MTKASSVNAVAAPPQPSTATTPFFANDDKWFADTLIRPDPEQLKELVMYGELTQLTYDSFRNRQQAVQVLSAPRPIDKDFDQVYKKEKMSQLTELLQPNSLAKARGYKVIDFLYANSGWQIDDLKELLRLKVYAELIDKSGLSQWPKGKDAAEWLQEQHNWIGFVALSDPGEDGKRDLAVVFRGTVTSTEWLENLNANLVAAKPWSVGASVKGVDNVVDQEPAEMKSTRGPLSWLGRLLTLLPFGGQQAKMCQGFKRMYACPGEVATDKRPSPQAQIHQDMRFVFSKNGNKDNVGTITCCGHSLGGALATLAAYDLAQDSCVPDGVKVRLRTFAGPKVGDEDFVKVFQGLGIDVNRAVNIWDIVPSLPGLTKILMKQLQVGGEPDVERAKLGIKEMVVNALRAAAGFSDWMSNKTYNPFINSVLGTFKHVADPVAMDSRDPKLHKLIKQPTSAKQLGWCHNLELLLHLLDPTRDPCLINKSTDVLLDVGSDCENWWVKSQDKVPPTCPQGCHRASN